jgi:hypothetical protein
LTQMTHGSYPTFYHALLVRIAVLLLVMLQKKHHVTRRRTSQDIGAHATQRTSD